MDTSILTSTEYAVIKPVNYVTTKVDFGSGIVPGFARTFVRAINKKMSHVANVPDIDENEMEKYLNFLLISRIQSITGKTSRNLRNLRIPALYALTLNQIGKVEDRVLGVSLVPYISDSDVRNLPTHTIEDAIEFSQILSIVEDYGFELVKGLPRDDEGSIDFMFFHVSENLVLRHEGKTHSGFAILTSFFKQKQLESVLSQRVTYGTIDEYDSMLQDLIYG